MARVKGANRWTRVAIGARALFAALLGVGAAVLAVDVSDWRYVRLDLTASGRNTVDPAVLDVVAKLPEPVVIDTFFRPLVSPYDGVSLQAAGRVLEFLAVLSNARRDKVEVRVHSAQDFEDTQSRQTELGVEGTNKIVLSCGARRAELQLFGELCSIDWGNPERRSIEYLNAQGIAGVINPRTWQMDDFRPAEFREFHGEELITRGLLKVSSGEAPRAYFVTGHGEPALEGPDPRDLGRLRRALAHDGFKVAEWDPLKVAGVPEDCDVLALIGASQPYAPGTRAAIQAYVSAGGRVIAAPDLNELQEQRAGGIVDVLREFGLETRPGVVCQPFVGSAGEAVDGDPQCAWLVIGENGMMAGHELTDPLRQRDRRLQFTFTASFDLGSDAVGVLPIVSSPPDSWRDLSPYDFRCNTGKGEGRDRYHLIVVKRLRSTKGAGGSVSEGRVLGIASAFFFENESFDVNRDFALNAFNWLAEREYRIAVSPLSKSQSYLDFQRSSARPVLSYTLQLGLPALCAVIGCLVFLRRRN